MSGGEACKCPERQKPVGERRWECWAYKCNHSAFNGYRYTPSDYSSVHCVACNALWRTKADWAGELSQGIDSLKKKTTETPMTNVQPLATDKTPITVRLEFQLKEDEDGYGPEINGLREEIEKETGVESCDSGTGFMSNPPTRDFGWPAQGKTQAEFIANVISSVMERRGYVRGDIHVKDGYMVTLFNPETTDLKTFGE